MSETRSYTLTEAARVTGRSRVTMRRYLDSARFPGAFRGPSVGGAPAPWRIPVGDLLAAGLVVGAVEDTGAAPAMTQQEAGSPVAAEIVTLREQLAAARAAAAERASTIAILASELREMRALAAEMLRAHLACAPEGSDSRSGC